MKVKKNVNFPIHSSDNTKKKKNLCQEKKTQNKNNVFKKWGRIKVKIEMEIGEGERGNCKEMKSTSKIIAFKSGMTKFKEIGVKLSYENWPWRFR